MKKENYIWLNRYHLFINGENVKDPEVTVDAFNNFFLTITENLNLYQEMRGDAISFLTEAFPIQFPLSKTIANIVTEIHSFEVKKKIFSLWWNNK
jgi:hypothetical protein